MRNVRIFPTLLLLLGALVGCQQTRSPQEIKEKTAEATSEAKQDAQALAQGVRQGWNSDHQLNLNSATKEQLLSLPGLTDAEADRIVARRPYNRPGELVGRRVILKTEYDRIDGKVTAE